MRGARTIRAGIEISDAEREQVVIGLVRILERRDVPHEVQKGLRDASVELCCLRNAGGASRGGTSKGSA